MCPECLAIVADDLTACPDCGYVWPVRPMAKHDRLPDETAQFVSGEPSSTFERWQVRNTHYKLWQSRDQSKRPTLCVEYFCGINRIVREWVCFQHDLASFAWRKAKQWWLKREGGLPIPESIDAALIRIECGELRKDAAELVIHTGGPWPEIRATVMGREAGDEDEPGEQSPDIDYSALPF